MMNQRLISICSKASEKNENGEMNSEAVEAVLNEDNAAAIQAGINPLVIPSYFNNIRENYYDGNKIIWLTDEIEWPIITEVIQKLNYYDDGTKTPIYIYIASPGGLCDAGWALIDTIEALKRKHIEVNTICVGSCSSMGAVILSAGTKGHRYAFPSSRIMIHQAGVGAFGIGGKLDEIANEVRELKYWTELSVKYLAKVTNKSEQEITKAMTYDNYMNAKEAIKFGIIDKAKVVLS